MLEGYIISWAVTDPVTGKDVVASMPLSEFWRKLQESSIEFDDLGFYLENGVALPVNPPAPEPFQGMEEGDIITMLNEYITSDPSGVRSEINDDDDEDEEEEEEEEEVTEDDETTDSEEESVFGNPEENKYYEWLQKQPSAKKKIESTFNILHKTLENIHNKPERKAVKINFNKGIKEAIKGCTCICWCW